MKRASKLIALAIAVLAVRGQAAEPAGYAGYPIGEVVPRPTSI